MSALAFYFFFLSRTVFIERISKSETFSYYRLSDTTKERTVREEVAVNGLSMRDVELLGTK